MKSLKPIEEETNLNLVASDVKTELDNKINTLQNSVHSLENDVDDLEAEVNKRNISKDSITANGAKITTLNADNGYIGELTSTKIIADNITANSSINTPLTRSDEISADDITTHILHTDQMDVSGDANISDITTDKITAAEGEINKVTSDSTKSNTLTATNATLSNATISNLNSPTKFEAKTLASDKLESTNAEIEKLTAELSEETKARIRTLFNQTRQFADDLTDANQFVVLGEPNSGSDGANDPRYIKVPNITTGWYRIELREAGNAENDSLFSIIYSNAETTPIIHYSKKHSGDLTHFYYDAETDTLWIETYASGYLYWSSDARGAEYAPETYPELDMDLTSPKSYSFVTSRKHQWVLMGNHTAEYALTVQGLIEADILKSDGDLKLVHFYGNDALELLHFTQNYFAHKDEEDEHLKDYQQAEVTGYIWHTGEKDVKKMYFSADDPVYPGEGTELRQETRWLDTDELTGYYACPFEEDTIENFEHIRSDSGELWVKNIDTTPFSDKKLYTAKDGERRYIPIIESPIKEATIVEEGLPELQGYFYIGDDLSIHTITGWMTRYGTVQMQTMNPVTLRPEEFYFQPGDTFNYTESAYMEHADTKVFTEAGKKSDTVYYYRWGNKVLDGNLNEVEIPDDATEVSSRKILDDVIVYEGVLCRIQDGPGTMGQVYTLDPEVSQGFTSELLEDIYQEYGWNKADVQAVEPGSVYEYEYSIAAEIEEPGIVYPYTDYDGTRCEALEKVRLINDNTIVLTVDSDYGQDDITIDYSDGEYGILPFVLGFTFRSKESDYLLNLDNFKGDPSVLEENE